MKQLWRLQSQCRHLQEHTSGVMSVRGDIAPPVQRGARRGKATASTHSDWSKKISKKKQTKNNKNRNKTNHKPMTYQQNNRLVTHQCPQDSTTKTAHY